MADVAPDNDILARIARVEADLEAEKTSLAHRFGLWGGLVALVISICAGGIGLYDRAVSALEEHERKVAEAAEIARQINAHGRKMVELKRQNDPQALYEYGALMNVDMLNLLARFEALGPEVAADLETGDLMLFSEHHIAQGRQARAVALAERAQENARDDLMLAEAKKQTARALFADGEARDLERARALLAEALEILAGSRNVNRHASAAGIHMNMVILEAYAGDCPRAQSALEGMRRALADQPPLMRETAVGTAMTGVAQSSACTLI